ncbi:MAG TPA: helix-hairpin-helix domain-containing protein [Chloroflexota bacterium]|nr:helix-hairpin-helix domain-containing protein [Chloroflexota bacterium]
MNDIELSIPFITNQEIARVLFQVGALLEMMEVNPFRVRAYRRAALSILFLPRPLVEYFGNDEEPPLTGVGASLRARLLELVNTGRLGTYDALLEEVGEPMVSLLSVEGIGPKTAVRLVSELGIGSVEDLVEAARTGRIRALHGFGPKREQRLAERAEALLGQAA